MHNHAPENYQCPFCAVVNGVENEETLTVEADVVFRGEHVTAFISAHQWPNNHGNVVIVPNEHYENIYDLPIHYAEKIHEVARAGALAMKQAFSCDGISTRQHNEPAGNQDLWHYHLHVAPRYKDDDFYAGQREFMEPEKRAEYARKIRENLAV